MKSKIIQCRLCPKDLEALTQDANKSGITTSEYLRDLIRSRDRKAPLPGEVIKAFTAALCRIQSMYPENADLNMEIKKLCRFLNL